MLERRIALRVPTHISMGMLISGDPNQKFAYIENLSESGIGLVSLDYLAPGTQISSNFYLPESGERINAIASVVHAKKSVDMIYYHGLRFEHLRDRDKDLISGFVSKSAIAV